MTDSLTINLDCAAWLRELDAGGNRQGVLAAFARAVISAAEPVIAKGERERTVGFLAEHITEARRTAYAQGRADGRREAGVELQPSAALVDALSAIADRRPVVNVAAPAVTVENHVEVPQRAVRATPQRDGTVIMEPVEG